MVNIFKSKCNFACVTEMRIFSQSVSPASCQSIKGISRCLCVVVVVVVLFVVFKRRMFVVNEKISF